MILQMNAADVAQFRDAIERQQMAIQSVIDYGRTAMLEDDRLPGAVSIPFATMPINVYVRGIEDQTEPPAFVEGIMDELRRDYEAPFGTHLGQRQLACLVEAIFLHNKPPDYRLVNTLTLRDHSGGRIRPDRVCSPCYTCDMSELDSRRLIRIALALGEGITLELRNKLLRATTEMSNAFPDTEEFVIEAEVTKIRLYFETRAFMWSVFSWVECVGLVRLPRSSEEALPAATGPQVLGRTRRIEFAAATEGGADRPTNPNPTAPEGGASTTT